VDRRADVAWRRVRGHARLSAPLKPNVFHHLIGREDLLRCGRLGPATRSLSITAGESWIWLDDYAETAGAVFVARSRSFVRFCLSAASSSTIRVAAGGSLRTASRADSSSATRRSSSAISLPTR